MKKLIVVVGMALFLSSCVNCKKMPDTMESYTISFGYSGGFTNIPMTYLMSGLGQMYKVENDSLICVNKVSKKRLKQLDEMMKVADFQNVTLNEHGNITYFIRYRSQEVEHVVSWTYQSDNDNIKLLYTELLGTIK